MTLPVRSIRLEKRTSKSLDTLSGSSGEIFFDGDQNTLRVYTANQSTNIVMADRTWVEENTFSGDFNDLTNKPTIVTDYSQLTGTPNLASVATTGSYFDLLDAPELDGLTVDISTIDSIGDVDTSTSDPIAGQLLQYDGTNWVNTTVAGFTNTDTTYALSSIAVTGGADVVLTDVDGITSTATIVGGTNTTVGININGQIEVSSSLPSLGQISDTVITNPQDGQLLGYNSGQWINVNAPAPQGGIELTDLSTTTASANGGGSLAYDNSLGVFTFTPPDLSSYATLDSFSVSTNTASGGGSLSYSNGSFTFRPAAVNGLASLTDFSVSTNAASGGGSLAYNNSTGVFTFTPAIPGGDLVDDTTPQLGGNLDLNTFDITGAGDINISGAGTFTGVVAADSFSSSATGAPSITSASTITLTAPDGVTVTDDGTNSVVIDAGNITLPLDRSLLFNPPNGSFITSTANQLTIGGPQGGVPSDYASVILGQGQGNITLNGSVWFQRASREVTHYISSATGVVEHNIDLGGVFAHKTPSADWTANFTNVPTDTGNTISLALIVIQGTTPYLPTAVQIGGAAQTILWQNGAAPTGTADGIDIISFTLIRDFPLSLWTVIGSGTSYS